MSVAAAAVLFAWSFAAATVLPVSSEIPLAVAVRSAGHWLLPVLIATAGNVLGACTTYTLARYAVTMAPAASGRARRAAALLARHGAPAMLLSWVPLIGDVLVLLAGATRLPVVPFLAWVTLGKAARYVAVGLAVQRF